MSNVDLVTEGLSIQPPTKKELLETSEEYREKAVKEVSRKANDALSLCNYEEVDNYIQWLKVYNTPSVDRYVNDVLESAQSISVEASSSDTLSDSEEVIVLEQPVKING